MFLSLAVVTCVATFALATPYAAAYEHVTNGGFESGTSGWWTRNDTRLEATTDIAAVEGSAAGELTLTTGSFEAHPSMSGTIAPGAYEFSAQVLTSNPGVTLDLTVAGSGFEESRRLDLTPGVWTRVAIDVHAGTADEPTITIAGRGEPGDTLYIDDVRFDGTAPVTRTPTATSTPPPTVPSSQVTPAFSATPTPHASPTPMIDAIAPNVRNGSFEDIDAEGLPFAWRKFGGEISSVTSPVHGGTRAARLDSGTDSMKWIYQPVRVDPGATYAFDAWIWQDDANVDEAFLRISWYASGDASGESVDTADSTGRLDAPSASFRQLTTGPVTAPADAHSAKLRIVLVPRSAARAAIVVDDVSFVPAAALAPAPAAAGAVEDDVTEHSAVAGRSTRRTTVRSGSALLDRGSGAHVGGATALVINEVLYDPDTASSDADGEWVEIYNTGAGDVSLVGWSLRDHARAVPLPDIVLPPHGFAVIAASDSFFSAYPGFDGIAGWLGGRIGNGLGNDGDLLELIAPDGVAVDAVSWGDDASALVPPVDAVGAGHSIERSPAGIDTNAAADFVDNAAPSPGRVHEADGANSKQQIGERTIEVLEASGESHFRWVPWALVALSGAALAGAVGWRALDAFRSRAGAT